MSLVTTARQRSAKKIAAALTRGNPHITANVENVLAPFLKRAQSGRYPLAESINVTAVVNCLRTIQRKHNSHGHMCTPLTQNLYVLSWRHPFQIPDWLRCDQEKIREFLRASLYKTVNDTMALFDCVRDTYYQHIGALPIQVLSNELGATFATRFSTAIEQYPSDEGIVATLAAFVALLKAGNLRQAGEICRVLEVLLQCVPVGPLKKNPSTWVVLCA